MRPIDAHGKTFMELRNPNFAVSQRGDSDAGGITVLFEVKKPFEPTQRTQYNGTAVELSQFEAERLWERLGHRLGKNMELGGNGNYKGA